MKFNRIFATIAVISAIVLWLSSCASSAGAPGAAKSRAESSSYAMGTDARTSKSAIDTHKKNGSPRLFIGAGIQLSIEGEDLPYVATKNSSVLYLDAGTYSFSIGPVPQKVNQTPEVVRQFEKVSFENGKSYSVYFAAQNNGAADETALHFSEVSPLIFSGVDRQNYSFDAGKFGYFFLPDSSSYLTASGTKVAVINGRTLKKESEYAVGDSVLTAIAFDRVKNIIYTADTKNKITSYSLATKAVVNNFVSKEAVKALRFQPGKGLMAWGAGSVFLLSETLEQKNQVAITPDAMVTLIASGGFVSVQGKTLTVYDANLASAQTIELPDTVGNAAVRPDGSLIAASYTKKAGGNNISNLIFYAKSENGQYTEYDIRNRIANFSYEGVERKVFPSFTDNGRYLSVTISASSFGPLSTISETKLYDLEKSNAGLPVWGQSDGATIVLRATADNRAFGAAVYINDAENLVLVYQYFKTPLIFDMITPYDFGKKQAW